MPFRSTPEGELIYVRPAPSLDEPGFSIEDFLEGESEEEAAAAARARTGTVGAVGTTTRDTTGRVITQFDEVIRETTRRYIDVPTPEEFLDSFENSYAGFLQGMREAGLSQQDISLALDPRTGLMNDFMSEYIGELAQRAERGEDLYEVVGVDGEPTLVGARPGEVTTQEITRLTESEAESVLQERGEEVTSESIQQVIGEDVQRQQEQITRTAAQTVTERETTTQRETGEREFVQTEEVFQRPRAVPVFQFSPSEFLTKKFGEDPGMLSTVIRGRGQPPSRQAVGARRV